MKYYKLIPYALFLAVFGKGLALLIVYLLCCQLSKVTRSHKKERACRAYW